MDRAAAVLQEQLGPDGLRKVGGKDWWQWRKNLSPLKAEWVEMRSHYNERKSKGGSENRVMLYVHGGAYFFGSVDEHRYQVQRHARKLGARAFSPRYRLSPQFPFPCGLQDCLAAYLFLLTVQEPCTIILAGDSAGGGMVLAMLVILRDQDLPLPAGAVLISPWVDLTHSFPSVAGECPLDFVPPAGFHYKPSISWPPPDEDEAQEMKKAATDQKKGTAASSGLASGGVPAIPDVANTAHRLSVKIDGKDVEMYTTNELLTHPLVSLVMQPTLGGLPPLLIIVGGGEILRDEQIYLAHKCADPKAYLPPDAVLNEDAKAQVEQHKPTDVQLQVWDDLCHVPHTLSFTRPAKHMYRSVAQFGAWALARAQETEIAILNDDEISIISDSASGSEETRWQSIDQAGQAGVEGNRKVGKAGDPLPRFKDHMIRQSVTRHGEIYPLVPASELPGCTMARDEIGVIKERTFSKWFKQKKEWDARFAHAKFRVRQKRFSEMLAGYDMFPHGDVPPPTALAGRRIVGGPIEAEKKKARSIGLALWSLWGSKHDEMTEQRREKADKEPKVVVPTLSEGQGTRPFADIDRTQQPRLGSHGPRTSQSKFRKRIVKNQTKEGSPLGNEKMSLATRGSPIPAESSSQAAASLAAEYVPDTGVTGKRPKIDGIAVPFSLGRKADTSSMLTLTSAMDQVPSLPPTPGLANLPTTSTAPASETGTGRPGSRKGPAAEEQRGEDEPSVGSSSPPFLSPLTSPGLPSPNHPLERFITANEDKHEPAVVEGPSDTTAVHC